MSWGSRQSAVNYCANKGEDSHIATLEDYATQNAVTALVENFGYSGSYWIGLECSAPNTNYSASLFECFWEISGMPLNNYGYFSNGEGVKNSGVHSTNYSDYGYGYISGGTWGLASPYSAYGVICEWNYPRHFGDYATNNMPVGSINQEPVYEAYSVLSSLNLMPLPNSVSAISGNHDFDKDGLTDYDEVDWNQLENSELKTVGEYIDEGGEIGDSLALLVDFISDGHTVGRFRATTVVPFVSDPTKADTDGDNLSDFNEVITYSSNAMDTDSDFDNLCDNEEINCGTGIWDFDSDDDSMMDGCDALPLLADESATVGELSIVSSTHKGFGHSFLVFKSNTAVNLNLYDFSGYDRYKIDSLANNDERNWDYAHFSNAEKIRFFVGINECVTFGAFSDNSEDISTFFSSTNFDYDGGGVLINQEIISGNSYGDNAYLTKDVTYTQLKRMVKYLEIRNYYDLISNNCAVVASSAYDYTFESHIVSMPVFSFQNFGEQLVPMFLKNRILDKNGNTGFDISSISQ